MIKVDLLLTGYSSCIIKIFLKEKEICKKRGILILKPKMKVSPEFIYIGYPNECASVIPQCTAPVTFFSAGDSTELAETNCEAVNLIVTNADLIDLHNIVTLNYTKFLEWSNFILSSINSGEGVCTLFDQIRQRTGTGFMLLDPRFHLMFSALGQESREDLVAVILSQGYLAKETIISNFPNVVHGISTVSILSDTGGAQYLLDPILEGDQRLGYLLVVNHRNDPEFMEVVNLLEHRVRLYLSTNFDSYAFRNTQFKSIFEDLINSNLKGLDNIKARLAQLPDPPKKYMRLIVVEFMTHNVPIDEATTKFELEFPKCNIARYENNIIILTSDTYHLFKPEFDQSAVEKILEEYPAIAVISHSGSRMVGLYTHYIQCKGMLKILPSLNKNSEQRFFEFEQYSLYYEIDLLAGIIETKYGHDDVMYLVHPAIVILTRYDRANRSNLRDFLFVFIMSDCNIAATARKLYMHRNTVIYRVKRIKELTGLTLENGQLRVQLAMTCLMMGYIENYQHRIIQFDDYLASDSCEGLNALPYDFLTSEDIGI